MLGENDRFSLVTYDSRARVLIPSTRVTDANRRELTEKINAVTLGGSTALFAGVSLAANEIAKCREAGFVNRIVLLSDGQANVGPSSAQELGRLGRGLVKEGVSVSTVGVGSDYNENLMTALAQNSDGNFYFVENSRDLSLIFEKELGSALAVAAKDVRLRIVCPPGITPKGILGHECRIHGQEIELDFNQIYAGHSKVLILQVGLPAAENGTEKVRPLMEGEALPVGSEVEVRLTLTASSAFDFVVLTDPKPAGFESTELLSGWSSDVLSFYRENRDAATNFFFDRVPAGTYTLRYTLRPTLGGSYHALPAQVQSMYAPEFSAHTGADRLTVQSPEK